MGASRTALVTGGARGLGLDLAGGLVGAGLSVVLLVRDARAGERAAATLRPRLAAAATCVVVVADVTDDAQVAAAVSRAHEAVGPIDLLVNNAGVIEPTEVPAWEEDPATWRAVLEADLLGPFHCVRAVVPAMLDAGGGRVVNLSSGAGAADRAVYSAYCAAKAGLFRLTGNLHLAGRDRGLRAFDVSPGTVRTDMTAAMGIHEHRTEWTPASDLVDLVVAIAGGGLDAWSGRYLRAGVDTPASLRAAEGDLGELSRRLRVHPVGPDDAAV